MTTKPLYESQELRTVRLYGTLGAKFGRVHRLAVKSTAEAVRALCVLHKGFEAYLMSARDLGVGFAVFLGKTNIGEDALLQNTKQDIRIAPILTGAKNGGIFNIILGAALIAVSFLIPGGSMLAAGLFNAGLAMAIGGVVQLLSPPPKDPQSKDKPENEPSYMFNGPVNTQAQGNCVPVAYGRPWTGSAVVSAGISVDDVYVPSWSQQSLNDYLLATNPLFYYPTMQEDLVGYLGDLLPYNSVTQNANGATFGSSPWGNVEATTGGFNSTGMATVLIVASTSSLIDAGVLKHIFSHTTNFISGFCYWGLYLRDAGDNMTPMVQWSALSGSGYVVSADFEVGLSDVFTIGFRTRVTLGQQYLDLIVDGVVVNSLATPSGGSGGGTAALSSGANTFEGNTRRAIGWQRELTDAEILQYSNYMKAGFITTPQGQNNSADPEEI